VAVAGHPRRLSHAVWADLIPPTADAGRHLPQTPPGVRKDRAWPERALTGPTVLLDVVVRVPPFVHSRDHSGCHRAH
jgi:hypothetical protein